MAWATEVRTRRWTVAAALVVAALAAPAAESGEREQLTVLVTSGTMGRLVRPDGSRTAADLAARLARQASEARARGRRVAILDAGRTLGPDATSRPDGGRTMLEVLAAGGCQVFVPDVMDATVGLGLLERLAVETGLPIVRSWARAEGASALPAALVLDLGGGLRLAVAGLMPAQEMADLRAAEVPDPVPLDPAEIFAGAGDALRLLVVHSAGHGSELATRELTWSLVEKAEDVDVLLDPDLAHEIVLRRDGDRDPLWLVGRRRDGRDPWAIARLELELERIGGRWRVLSLASEAEIVSPDVVADPTLDDSIRAHLDRLREDWDAPLPAAAPNDREGLERFVLETLREAARAEVAVLNWGALRPVAARFFAGETLSREAVVRMLSIDQTPVVVELDGEALARLAAASIRRTDADGRPRPDALRFLGLGMTVTDPGPQATLADLEVNGRPLRPGDRYRVATTGYLAAGGDEYPELADADAMPLHEGAAELRSDLVLPRLERAAEPFVDLERRPLWRFGVSRLGLLVDVVRTTRDPSYVDASDTRARADDSLTMRGDAALYVDRELASWLWENRLWAKYGVNDAEGADLREIDDDLRFDSSVILTRTTVLGGASPYASVIVDSELRANRAADDDRLPRQLEESVTAGLTWASGAWQRIRLGAVGRRYPSEQRENQRGLLAEIHYRRDPGDRRLGLEGRLLAESLWGGEAEVRRLDLDLRLLVPVFGRLDLAPGLNWYLYERTDLVGHSEYLRFTLGLTYRWGDTYQVW